MLMQSPMHWALTGVSMHYGVAGQAPSPFLHSRYAAIHTQLMSSLQSIS